MEGWNTKEDKRVLEERRRKVWEKLGKKESWTDKTNEIMEWTQSRKKEK